MSLYYTSLLSRSLTSSFFSTPLPLTISSSPKSSSFNALQIAIISAKFSADLYPSISPSGPPNREPGRRPDAQTERPERVDHLVHPAELRRPWLEKKLEPYLIGSLPQILPLHSACAARLCPPLGLATSLPAHNIKAKSDPLPCPLVLPCILENPLHHPLNPQDLATTSPLPRKEN